MVGRGARATEMSEHCAPPQLCLIARHTSVRRLTADWVLRRDMHPQTFNTSRCSAAACSTQTDLLYGSRSACDGCNHSLRAEATFHDIRSSTKSSQRISQL
eukprot:4802013-Prymnesium_polylepis.1